jgi:hypothetical protein
VSNADVRERLKSECGRDYLYGAVTSLIERIAPEHLEQARLVAYTSLTDAATAVELLGLEQRDNAVARLVAKEVEDKTERGTVPMGLARFLRYGDPDTPWQGPPPRAAGY